jgi:hypothetical protein
MVRRSVGAYPLHQRKEVAGMKRYHGGEKVGPGVYLNAKTLSFASMSDEGALPGAAGDEYRPVPAIAMLIVGPALGLVYALFLPFIGLAMVASMLGGKLGHLTADAAAASARVLRPAWEPATSFLIRLKSGRRGRNRVERKDAWVEEVKKELESDEEH